MNEASDGARSPCIAAASGRVVLPATSRRLSLMGSLGWASAAPEPHAGNSDGDIAIELLSEVVTWLVLVWFGRQRGMKSWVFDGLYFFKAPWTVFSVLGAVGGCRVLRCGRSGGPPPRD